jgi:SpoVK/Ycf46/Vps4 family AAA+-type ATPase
LRESFLHSAIPYFDMNTLSQERVSQVELVEQIIANVGIPVFIATEKPKHFSHLRISHRVIPLELPMIGYEMRVKFWKQTVNIPTLNHDIERLATSFLFSPGEIIDSVEDAKGLASLRAPKAPSLRADDLWQAARNLPRHTLGELAQKISTSYTWEDIVLPEDLLQHLREICQQVTYQSKVYDEWGLKSKLPRGAGLSVLFSGLSGTGKTMAAEVIAHELNLDLYKIDLSSVVNKYIGETEKNLKKVFDEAEKSNAILFFDEADALFGKRSEVKDSHDRYSNIEINYLLQKMEEYKGLCILATNMRQALDDAFIRRIRFVVEFSMPEPDQRKIIWQKGFEPQIPHNGVDFEFLSQQFKISGGNIRNITLNAAFLAAAEGGKVEMKHLIRATKREFSKIGKLCLESEFGPYHSLLK